ncbi:MAG: Multifunctional CCA protein [bacterium ADurb.Bin236]|nr:MAG: Multifunctional CCA protein [bacterium ADurb.Bin236]HOY61730.1 hypothetical protein [bacterium]HPN93079.1 hypothetical protein [bacterium]
MNLGAKLKESLPEAWSEALAALGKMAADAGLRLCVVGGCARDMAMGLRPPDVDLVLEGDAVKFAAAAARALGLECESHARFGVATLRSSSGFRFDVASARTETYSRPGALPDVSFGSIEDDLRRRDFAINAIAVELRPGSFGEALDPFGGLKDIEAGIVRLLHSKSFIDDPTRIARCARFSGRLSFDVETETAALAADALASGAMDTVSGERIKKELKALFEEKPPGRGRAVAAFSKMGVDSAVCSGYAMSAALFLPEDLAAESETAAERFAADGEFCGWMAGLAAASIGNARDVMRRLSGRICATREEERILEAAGEIDAGALSAALESAAGGAEVCGALEALPLEALAAFRAAASPQARASVDDFLLRLRGMKLEITGEDLARIGFGRGPSMGAALAELLSRKRDGLLSGAADELAAARDILNSGSERT